MIDYWLVLLALCCLALVIIFWPLTFSFRKGLALIFIVFTLALVLASNYFFTNTQQAIEDYQEGKDYALIVADYLKNTDEGVKNPESIDVMSFLRSLQRYLQLNSFDSDAWFVLGNALQGVNNNQHSLMAYQRAYRVNRNDDAIAIAYVNARLSLLRGGQGKLDVESISVLDNVLKQNPHHENALMLLGVTGFEGKDYDLAIEAWEQLLVAFQIRSQKEGGKNTPQNVVDALQASITKAKDNKRLESEQVDAQQGSSDSFALSLMLSLNKELIDRLSAKLDENSMQNAPPVLFVYARKPNQRGMPLAAIRLPLSKGLSFPMALTLSNTNSLAGIDLSQLESLDISARVSFSGQAIAQNGDWQSDSVIVEKESYSKPVNLTIDKVKGGA